MGGRGDAYLRRRDGCGDHGRLHGRGGASFRPTARGASFGLLSTASLTGLALSPIVSGFLGATSIRAVFLLDALALVFVGFLVSRLMKVGRAERTATPVAEEL